jgi:hypothetical protein
MIYLEKSFKICNDNNSIVIEEDSSTNFQIRYFKYNGETISIRKIEKEMIPLLIKALEEMIKDYHFKQ